MVRDRSGQVRATVWGVLAAALVWGALVLPSSLAALSWGSLVRLPLGVLVVLAALIVVPPAARRAVALVLGGVLALVVVLKSLDIGFSGVMDRRFHVLHDVANLERGYAVLADWVGRGWAVAAVAVLVLVTLLVVVLLVPAVLRLSRVVAAHRRPSLVALLVGALVWGACALAGVQVGGSPVASTATAGLVREHVAGGYADYRDPSVFGTVIASDPWAGRSGLLDGLAGKDVLIVFVESYGAAALTDPVLAKGVAPVLAAGEESLAEVGVEARSGWLTSPTFGAGSWLAHATLQSGLWVDDDRRHEQLLAAHRLTLTRAFSQAGWRTGFVQPAVEATWPEGKEFYGYDRLHAAEDLRYRGPALGWGEVPDQYTLSWVHRQVLATGGAPVMAQVDLVTSHNPWPHPPPFVPWGAVGDGLVYSCMPGCADDGADDVRSRYAASIGYSLESVVSFAAEHPDLVVLLMGDHQPWAYVTGEAPSHDVPVSLIAADPAVLERISQWGWTPGLVPGEQSPVWRMDAFRDQFLTAFSTRPPGPAPGAAHRRSAGSRSRAPAARRGRRSPRTPCRDEGSR